MRFPACFKMSDWRRSQIIDFGAAPPCAAGHSDSVRVSCTLWPGPEKMRNSLMPCPVGATSPKLPVLPFNTRLAAAACQAFKPLCKHCGFSNFHYSVNDSLRFNEYQLFGEQSKMFHDILKPLDPGFRRHDGGRGVIQMNITGIGPVCSSSFQREPESGRGRPG